MTMCNFKGITSKDKPTEMYHLTVFIALLTIIASFSSVFWFYL